jgi:SlyX protein
MEEGLVDLQSRLAFQEDTLDQLNRVVAAQQRRIDELQGQVDDLKQQLRSLAPSPAADARSEPPPPHY